MGIGTDLARELAPEHAQMMDDFKDQLLLALIRRQADENGRLTIPVKEVDDTGDVMLAFSVDQDTRAFKFMVVKKH